MEGRKVGPSTVGSDVFPSIRAEVYMIRLPAGNRAVIFAKALNPNAWSFLQELAPTYRRHFVGWIHSAKRPETREERIRESIALLAAGKI